MTPVLNFLYVLMNRLPAADANIDVRAYREEDSAKTPLDKGGLDKLGRCQLTLDAIALIPRPPAAGR